MSKNNLQPYVAYVVPASLYTIWQISVGLLNTNWTMLKIGESYAAGLYTIFFLAHALSVLYFAFWLEKPITRSKLKTTTLTFTLMASMFTLLMAYSKGTSFIINCLLSAIAGGFIAAYLIAYLLFNIRPERRGIVIGLSAAIGVSVQFLLFSLILTQQQVAVLVEKTIFTAGIIFFSGLLVLVLPAFRDCLWTFTKDNEQNSESPTVVNFSIQVILFAVLLCFFMAYGMHDLAGTTFMMRAKSNIVLTMLFIVAGFVVAGRVWDSKKWQVVLGGSFVLLSMGFINVSLQRNGLLSYAGFVGVQVASAFFGMAAKLFYLDLARFYTKPVVVASLGLVFPIILKQFGVVSAGVIYKLYGKAPIHLGSLVFIIVAMPFVIILFKRLNEVNKGIAHNLANLKQMNDPENVTQ